MKVVHCKKESYDIYIGRPSKWGNPYSHLDGTSAEFKVNTRQEAIEAYRNYILNDRDTKKFSEDLAARQTLQGRPEYVWKQGQIGQNVAGFDNVMTGSFLSNITDSVGTGAATTMTVTGNQSFAPSGGSVNATTKVVTNVDYREATIVVDDSSKVAVGDKITFSNSGTTVKSVGLADKNTTGQAMTFTVIELPSSTTIKVYPKPIAADDPALSTLEKAYANIDTRILNAATVTRLNIDTTAKANIFFDKSAVEVIGGTIPAELFKQYDGMKVITDSLKNGLQLYMVYDANLDTMNFRYRIFVWYGVTICNPSNCGAAVTY